MTENIINITSFQGNYKTGLIFSIIDGLKLGHHIKFICDEHPSEFEKLLLESGLQNLSWKTEKKSLENWELIIYKNESLQSQSVGCCGMCGGHSTEKHGV